MYSFIAAALLWVTAQFDYAGTLPAPAVQWATQAEMIQVAGAAEPEAREHIIGHGLRLGGMYVPDSDTIYLRRGLDLDRPEHRAILVHELVHYVQDQLGVQGTTEQLENQAYALQDRWLQEQGGR